MTSNSPFAPAASRPADPMTDRQAAFIRSLMTEQADLYRSMGRTAEADAVDGVLEDLDDMLAKGTRTSASRAIESFINQNKALKAEARTVAQAAGPKPQALPEGVTDGLYVLGDGRIVKLQYSRASGDGRRLYGKVLDAGTGTFYYAPGIVAKVTAADKMTLDQAAQYGHLYGRCVACGRELTDEVSIARGIGPICASRF